MKSTNKIITLLLMIISLSACKNKTISENEIINRAIQAYGGKTNLRSIQRKKEIGTTIIYLQDTVFRTSRYQQFYKSPNKSYYESPINRPYIYPKLIYASNGRIQWTQNDGAWAPYLQPKEETTDRKGEDYPFLFTLKEREVNVEFIKTVGEKGKTLHLLKYTSKDGKEEDVYFDNNSGLISKTYKTIQTSIGQAEIIQLFDDYRLVGGVQIPFRVESQFPPNEVDLNIINQLEINQPINDSIFEFQSPPILSSSEISTITGNFTNESTSLSIIFENDQLMIQKDVGEKVTLDIVKKDFFMFRIGQNEKSHIENIAVESFNENRVEKIKLFYKEQIQYLKRQ